MTNKPTLLVGSLVAAPGFRNPLTILSGPNKKGEYHLQQGSLSIWIHESQLSKVEHTKKNKKKTVQVPAKKQRTTEVLRLDFHGHTVSQTIEKLEQAIDRAILEEISTVEIVHGLGTGALKNAIHTYLSQSKHIKSFRIDDRNQGVTRAYL